MRKILISTENTSDLTREFLNENEISSVNLLYYINGEEILYKGEFNGAEYYQAMLDGADTRTSLVNETMAEEYFTKLLEQGKDIVHISFSSALSGTCQNVTRAAENLNKTHKNKIYVVDSLCACAGQGLLVELVNEYACQGNSAESVSKYAEELKHKVCHYFTVHDIKYLVRGGRVTKVAGFVAKVANIKPVMHCDQEGRLVALEKKFSRKKAIVGLFDNMKAKFSGISNKVYIAHAECIEDADYLAELIKAEFDIDCNIVSLGPVIGAHSGPKTLALFFVGTDRVK